MMNTQEDMDAYNLSPPLSFVLWHLLLVCIISEGLPSSQTSIVCIADTRIVFTILMCDIIKNVVLSRILFDLIFLVQNM